MLADYEKKPKLNHTPCRYWLTPPEDAEFDAKVEDITGLYMSAIERHRQGERTIFIDEMTVIQATER